MSILCKFNAGKRLNLTQRRSFATRSHLTGLRYNDGIAWQATSWKSIKHKSPGNFFKTFIAEKQRNHEVACKRRLELPQPKSKQVNQTKTSSQKPMIQHYGDKADETILSTEEFILEKNRLLDRFQVCQEAQRIENKSKGQWDNPSFISVRKDRLTASFFGEVCRRREITPCHNLVNKILYGHNFTTEAMEYGKLKEKAAISKFKKARPNCVVKDSGFFIDTENGYLGASPDGLIIIKKK